MIVDIEKEIENIKARNLRVEIEKAWELSWTRRSAIAILTYLIALAWLWLIDETKFALKALVPVVGYWLSTVSLPIVKRVWLSITEKVNEDS